MDRSPDGCDDLLRWTRRAFLKRAAAAAAAGVALPTLSPRVFAGTPGSDRDVLLYILLRGGLDGLSTVVPYGDGALYAARPTIAVPPPGAVGGCLDLDGFFGLNPVAAPLLPAFVEGRLAFVHAAGSPDPTRSHFLAFEKMEAGTPAQPLSAAGQGWLSRHLLGTAGPTSSAVRCASLREVLPQGLFGAPATVPASDLGAVVFPGDPASAPLRKATLEAMYAGAPDPLGPAALTSLHATDLFGAVDFAGYAPANGARYPDTDLGGQLAQCAALIKADAGVEVLMVEVDGFDHHADQGPLDGALALLLDDVARSLAAFDQDIGAGMDRVIVAAHSEFGRRVAENASLGTDHGHGGLILLLGGHVAGGQVHGSWPGLHPAALADGDLAITTDYRDVMGEILTKRLGNTDLSFVFPQHVPSVPGVIA